MKPRVRRSPVSIPLPILTLVVLATLVAAPATPAQAQGDQVTWGVHINLAPTWLDPAEPSGIITPYMIYYALHDALAKPMPGQSLAPSLAEDCSVARPYVAY